MENHKKQFKNAMIKITEHTFDNQFVNNFPGDKSGNKKPRQTPEMLFSLVQPTPVNSPKLIGWSEELSHELGVLNPESQIEVDVLGGNYVTKSMQPYAACYAGHQFGNWAGQLGDGRAITVGEWSRKDGKSFEFQLKGAGITPYSRNADGRAVLRSSVREFLMSEAKYYLQIPTTRALSLVTTGDQVMRDMFYNGNPEYEPGAIVMRVAPSFLRFGNFEILAARKEINNLKALVDWTIERYFPHIQGEDKILKWFYEVQRLTAEMVVNWLRVGFVHGVMNTDNMSILGLTIDYGPFSFMDQYDPAFTPNTTDLPGRRYAFGNQAAVSHWNLSCLANAILPLFEDIQPLQQALNDYKDIYKKAYLTMMRGKLGLTDALDLDHELISDLENLLASLQPDYTIFYQQLMSFDFNQNWLKEELVKHFEPSYYENPSNITQDKMHAFFMKYSERVANLDKEKSLQLMKVNNPRFILRNYLLHQAIEKLENNDQEMFNDLFEALKSPYSTTHDQYYQKRPEWAIQKAGCSMLSCSS